MPKVDPLIRSLGRRAARAEILEPIETAPVALKT
ncbi:hypothetical protein OKW28_001407 [Paraburkholderia sp. 40]